MKLNLFVCLPLLRPSCGCQPLVEPGIARILQTAPLPLHELGTLSGFPHLLTIMLAYALLLLNEIPTSPMSVMGAAFLPPAWLSKVLSEKPFSAAPPSEPVSLHHPWIRHDCNRVPLSPPLRATWTSVGRFCHTVCDSGCWPWWQALVLHPAGVF